VYATFEDVRFVGRSDIDELLSGMQAVYAAQGDSCRQSRVLTWWASHHEAQGRADAAMVELQEAKSLFHSGCDSLVYMSMQVSLASILLNLGDLGGALSVCDEALGQWNPVWPRSPARNGLYNNRAIALASMGDLEGGLAAFRDVLRNAREEGELGNERNALSNLGAVFGILADGGADPAALDSAALYVELALQLEKEHGNPKGIMTQFANRARIARDRGRFRMALTYLDSAHALALSMQSREILSSVSILRAECFQGLGMLDSAVHYMQEHVAQRDTLINTEMVRAVADVQEKYESEKKARQILGLQAENLQAEVEKEQVKRTRNIFLFSGIGILFMAGMLWSRLRFVHRSRAAIQKEKDRSEELLLNILPEEVAEELKEKGEAEARLIDQVTVLFTDFKGFTAMSEKVTPKQLVKDLHECFSAFDRICVKHGLEKIKTIGDAYMAAGGLPTPNTTHATDVIRAALEMRDFIAEGKARKVAAGLPYFEIRIGIHTGPVVAGIVGVKKFSYDIWGDTVNTASRMESSGEVGKVNISGATYLLVKNDNIGKATVASTQWVDPPVLADGPSGFTSPAFFFIPRGMVQAKGKGEMEMFFVGRSSEGA
jgi:adenylate cyclase